SARTKRPEEAPRLSASIPRAPLPAKRSRIFAPMTWSARLEKMAALTRSIVGRTPRFGTSSLVPPAEPAMTLMVRAVLRSQERVLHRWLLLVLELPLPFESSLH